MREIKALLPDENILYLGDTARLPYGNKSEKSIIQYTLESVAFLSRQEVKVIVIACNTACAFALNVVQQHFSIPLFDVIIPGIEQVIEEATLQQPRIAIIGTRGTIESGIHKKILATRLKRAYCTSLACPLFVPLVEEGYTDHPLTVLTIKEYLSPLKKEKINTLLLACTHYPLLFPLIQQEMGEEVRLIDPAKGCAKKVKEFLTQNALLNPNQNKARDQFFVTDDPEKFRFFGKIFLHANLEHVMPIIL